MEAHFTYSDDTDVETLSQGDILEKNEQIEDILKDVHPHYLKEDYKFFIVLTQSCDLVRRSGNQCKARYLTLAAVRPFSTVLKRELEKCQSNWFENKGMICSLDRKGQISEFIRKLLNNNQPDYFYLHEDESKAFPESMCAFLRLSIAIKAKDHYETCLNAKKFELREEFRAKLGWLVGNLYSRVGTMDWTPIFKTDPDFKKIIKDLLEKNALWVDKKIIKALKKRIEEEKLEDENLDKEAIHALIKDIHIPTIKEKRERIFNHLREILSKPGFIEDKDINTLMKRIENDQFILSHLK